MKNIATWFVAGVIVATAVAGCTVEATTTGGGGTGGTGGSGTTGGSGGTTGGSAGTTATGGASGSAGTAGAGGSGGAADAGSDTPVIQCVTNPNDPACNRCAFSKCQDLHCQCNAIASCRAPMLMFYSCASMPNAKIDECAVTFAVNANPDGMGGALAGDLAECMVDHCTDTCAGREAGTSNISQLRQSLRTALGHADQR